jgi:hypothetical protein
MGLSTALYRKSLLSIDSVDLLPSSQCICFAFSYVILKIYINVKFISGWLVTFIRFY